MIDQDADRPERRAFFKDAARRLARPIGDFLETRAAKFRTPVALRPPGAIGEACFADVCARCGACVEACPAHAIFPLPDAAGIASGTPAINPDEAACVVCTGLQCTTVCPSGALLPVLEPRDIRMGLASVYSSLCVRSAGEPCALCVDRCPLGSSAIRFNDGGPPEVLAAGCVGCGVCQLFCPTDPKAIVVTPHESVTVHSDRPRGEP